MFIVKSLMLVLFYAASFLIILTGMQYANSDSLIVAAVLGSFVGLAGSKFQK